VTVTAAWTVSGSEKHPAIITLDEVKKVLQKRGGV
jgi:hypothetical protein